MSASRDFTGEFDRGRIPELDGLRGLAALSVVLAHYFGEVPHGARLFAVGWAGVDMFFALSGYLIGGILLDHGTGRAHLRQFYGRRAFRILPIYITVVTLTLVALAALAPGRPSWIDRPLSPLAYATFTQNFVMAMTGDTSNLWLLPMWTLAVEEQFYLFLPLLLWLVPRRRLPVVVMALILLAPIARGAFLRSDAPEACALVLLPCRWDAFLFGILAAMAVRSPGGAPSPTRLRASCLVGVWAGVASLALDRLLGTSLFPVLGHLCFSAAFASYLLLVVCRHGDEGKSLRSPTLRFLGVISYGLYLIHQPIAGLLHGLLLGRRPDVGTVPGLAVMLLALAVSVALSWVSWCYFESPLIRFGRCWSRGRDTGAPLRQVA